MFLLLENGITNDHSLLCLYCVTGYFSVVDAFSDIGKGFALLSMGKLYQAINFCLLSEMILQNDNNYVFKAEEQTWLCTRLYKQGGSVSSLLLRHTERLERCSGLLSVTSLHGSLFPVLWWA